MSYTEQCTAYSLCYHRPNLLLPNYTECQNTINQRTSLCLVRWITIAHIPVAECRTHIIPFKRNTMKRVACNHLTNSSNYDEWPMLAYVSYSNRSRILVNTMYTNAKPRNKTKKNPPSALTAQINNKCITLLAFSPELR